MFIAYCDTILSDGVSEELEDASNWGRGRDWEGGRVLILMSCLNMPRLLLTPMFITQSINVSST